MTSTDIHINENVKPVVLKWLETVHAGGARYKYSCHMQRPWAVESSAMAAMLLVRVLGQRPDGKQLAGWVREIQGWQDTQSGLFKDPLITEADRIPQAVHTWEHIWNHHTGVCDEALHDLGVAPLYPLPEAGFGLTKDSLNEKGVEAWVLGLNWENPWLVGEHFYRGISMLKKTGAGSEALIHRAFAAIEGEILGPQTGYPDRRNRSGVHSAMAGLFKVMFGYHLAGRPLPNAEKALDSTLALQTPDGGMGQDNLCIHWDAAWVVKNLTAQLAGRYRLADIRAAGHRLGHFLRAAHGKSDGGFSFHRDHCVTCHNSIRVSESLAESDMMGTLMSCECLNYSAEWDAGIFRPTVP